MSQGTSTQTILDIHAVKLAEIGDLVALIPNYVSIEGRVEGIYLGATWAYEGHQCRAIFTRVGEIVIRRTNDYFLVIIQKLKDCE